MAAPTRLRRGVTVWVTPKANVMYRIPFPFEIAGPPVTYGHTPDGWAWLDGFQLAPTGALRERREIFVRPDRLTLWRPPAGIHPRRAGTPTSIHRTTAEEAIVGSVAPPIYEWRYRPGGEVLHALDPADPTVAVCGARATRWVGGDPADRAALALFDKCHRCRCLTGSR